MSDLKIRGRQYSSFKEEKRKRIMHILPILVLTSGAVMAAESGNDKEIGGYFSRRFIRQIERQKMQLSRNAAVSKEEIINSHGETKDDSSSADNNMNGVKNRNVHLSSNVSSTDNFESDDSGNIQNTNITSGRLYTLSEGKEKEYTKGLNTEKVNHCNISVAERSVQYFQSQLLTNDPHFVQFRIRLTGNTTHSATKDVFQGGRWYWTFNTSSGPFPFLSWNLDYGLLTFGLLDAKTIHIPYVNLNVSPTCRLTYGSNHTSFKITEALKSLISFKELKHDYIRYRESYFCYLVTNDELLGTLGYYAAQYFIYPLTFVHFKCCTVNYNYNNRTSFHSCPRGKIPGIHTWSQTSHLPFILGFILLAFCPIPMFQLFAWTAKRDRVVGNDPEQDTEASIEGFQLIEDEENWVYADGVKSPFTFHDLFSFDVFGLYDTYPILTSRLRRLLTLVLAPSIIYIQIAWYSKGLGVWDENDKITVKDLVEVGTPMGFLSLFVDPGNKYKTFVPGLGGPLIVMLMYFLFGLLFLVLPRCLKQIVEDGLPNSNLYIPSPLFFGYKEIVKMSKIQVEPDQLEPGYTKASTLMKCSFYLLFTTKFWIRLWRIQTRRLSCYGEPLTFCLCVLSVVILPLYVIFCIIEILLCLLYYGLPFCFFLVFMVKGATKAVAYLRDQSGFLLWMFSFKIFIVVGVFVVSIMFSLLSYVTGLLFITSFKIVTQVITLCFVAVIIYPSVSFGYLFFFTIVLYYFIKQIRNFSDVYTELLSSAVEISKTIAHEPYNVTLDEGYLTISNINYEGLKGIRVNGNILDGTEVCCMVQNIREPLTVKKKNNAFGIPQGLFDFLVARHRPVHQQFLTLVFKLSIMLAFIFLTLSILSSYVTGPTTEISEVMHVIFIVVVGVIPQLIGVAFANSNSVLVREIEERKIEKSIREYWSTR